MSSPSRSRARLSAGAALLLLLGAGIGVPSAQERLETIAVFPVDNLSGGLVPAEAVRTLLIDRLVSNGIKVLRDDVLEEFMTRHRMRYAAGIETATAESLREESGVDGVVFPSIELSSDAVPPKIALFARLVSIKVAPTVVWADAVGMAGDDAPGFFELGLVDDYQKLQASALGRLGDSLLAFLQTGEARSTLARAPKFRPRSAYRAVVLEPGRSYSVAVVPFFNLSERRNAGEILALLFMRHLSPFAQFRVVDTGVVRRQLLDARIIMGGGLSISDAETVAALIDADFVLGGRVTRYEDHEGSGSVPRVEFSTVLIERRSRRVVWSSDSYNDGNDGVRFFERGTSRTAHSMATQMVRLTAEMIAGLER